MKSIRDGLNKLKGDAGFFVSGGIKSDDERDEAMTENSDYDIAWVREGKERSGTAKNINRRSATD